MRKAVSTN